MVRSATALATLAAPVVDVMKALADPIRWDILMQMAAVDELACTTLEQTLPVGKSTISHHIKTLAQAGLIDVRKVGRNYFYTLRRDVLSTTLNSISANLGVPSYL
jgi:DNA-binding transcriptional ArsR family regulator